MKKHLILTGFVWIFGILLVSSLSFVSANTLVGGKIYNYDFSEVIEGALVSVECGADILNTLSLSDGSYAVSFDTESCYESNETFVSASKGELYNEENSIINYSEEEGEFISIANINVLLPGTVENKTYSREKSGSWFMCGNTVCDSGETFQTCPKDCDEKVIEEEVEEATEENSNSETTEFEEQEIQNEEETQETAGITGAVIDVEDSNNSLKKSSFVLFFAIFLFILIVAIAIIGSIKGKKDTIKNEIVQTENADGNVVVSE